MRLDERYAEINQRFETITDLPEEALEKSRSLFDLKDLNIVPRNFDVWTFLVGLPINKNLSEKFEQIVSEVSQILSPYTRFYKVLPENYHWEFFIIKRPNENVSQMDLDQAPILISHILKRHSPFTITYRGFLITSEGTIIVKGFGEFDAIRQEVQDALPFASPKQSQIGHISLGRILDPVGSKIFIRLKNLRKSSDFQTYGGLLVDVIKYVHETQWYMETKELVAYLPLK